MPRISSQRLRHSSQEEAACSQSSQQSWKSQTELEELVNKCVNKILAENFSLLPFKKTDFLCGSNIKGRNAKQLVEKIKNKLSDVYGLTLIENENKFLLLNPKNKVLNEFKSNETSSPSQVLLGIILALIVHNNGEISADDLKSFFAELKVDIEGEDLYFENVKKKLNILEHQHYLEKIVRPVPSQPSQVFYKWGLRSEHEMDKKDLLPLVGMMYRMPPEELPQPLIRLYSDD